MASSEVNHKQSYAAPKLSVIGSLEEMTQATNAGGFFDGMYPTGTPVAGHTEVS
jgi:hypothetical protein